MIQGPGYGLTFLYYFAITAVIGLVLGHQGTGIGWQDPLLYRVAVPFALFAASIGAYINHNTLVTIPTNQQSATAKQLQTILQQRGYEAIDSDAGVTTYSRSGLSRFLAGQVFVQVEPKQIMLSGRAKMVQMLEKQMNKAD